MGGHLRILSGNLYRGEADPDALADLVRLIDADVVGLQELGAEQAEALAAVLPYGRLEPKDCYRGMGFALRNPAAYMRLGMPCRDAAVVRLEPSDWPQLSRPLEVINIHIAAPHVCATWVNRWRPRQVNALLAHLDASPEQPRVVIGDFNSTPAWPVYWRVASRLEDLARTHARQNGTRPLRTWGPGPNAPRLLRIDHCFANGVRVESLEVLDIEGSDHDALLVDLSLD